MSKELLPMVRNGYMSALIEENSMDGPVGQRLVRFLILAFHGASIRLKLTEGETYQMVKDILGDVEFPDGADLVDELGAMLTGTGMIDYYDNVPYVREFVDSLHDYCRANVELGIACEDFTASMSFQTEGIKELFDLIMDGMS